jgi:hypothetical protein
MLGGTLPRQMARRFLDRVGPYLKRVNLGGIRLIVGVLGIGCGGVTGTETPLTAIEGKAIALTMSWERRSPNDPSMLGEMSVTLNFSATGKLLGNDCPIVNAAASFGGVVLSPSMKGGTMKCGVYDDRGCDKACLWAEWHGNVTSVLLNSPDEMDLILRDSGGEAVITIRNPVTMVKTTVLDLIEGQVVRYGDTFHVRVGSEDPVTKQDIESDLSAELYAADQRIALPMVSDKASGADVWRVDIVPAGLRGGPAALDFLFDSVKMRFDACPSDYVCGGSSDTERGAFALEYSP